MPVRIPCPNCAAVFTLPDSMKDKVVRITCKKCGAGFSVGKPPTLTHPEGDRGKKGPAEKTGMRPAKQQARSPRARLDPADDLDFDEDNGPPSRPASRRGRSGPGRRSPNWWQIGGLGGAAALGLGVLLIVLLSGPSEEERALAEAKRQLEALAKDFKDKLPKGIDFKGFDPTKIDPFKFDPTKLDPKKETKSEPPEKKVDPVVVAKKDPEPPAPKEPITLKLEGGVRHLALSPDGKLIALAWNKLYEHGLDVYQWPDLTLKQKWKADLSGNRGLVFGADNRTVYAIAQDPFSGRAVGFDAGSGKDFGPLIVFKSQASFVAAAPDNSLIVAGNKNEVKTWSPATRKDLKSFAPSDVSKIYGLQDARVFPDGKVLLATRLFKTESQVRLWDPASGAETMVVKDIPGYIHQLVLTRDAGKVAFVYDNSHDGGGVRCCDREGKELWFWKPPIAQSVMSAIALSVDDKYLAVAGNSSTIRVLDMADGKVLGGFKSPNFQTQAVAFHRDGKLISGEEALRIWDLADLRPVDAPKDPVVVVKKDPPKDIPKGPEIMEYDGAIVRQLDYQIGLFEAAGKPVRVERLKETAWLDAAGMAIPDGSPRLRILANPGNVVNLKVRSEGGKQILLQMKLVRAISDVPIQPGNFELKGARVKQYGARRMILTDAAGKDHMAIIDALGICYDKTGTNLEDGNSARIFKVNNVVDAWLYPEPGRDFNHVNVARLVSGDLMTDAELKAPPPDVAKTERFTGKLRVRDVGGKKEYTLGISVKIGKKVGSTHRNLVPEDTTKAYDMTGNPVPWATIFHDNNTLDVLMETRGVFGTVKEAKLISGTVK